MNNNFQPQTDNVEAKSKSKGFWRNVGFVAIALALAAITVFVLNLNINA